MRETISAAGAVIRTPDPPLVVVLHERMDGQGKDVTTYSDMATTALGCTLSCMLWSMTCNMLMTHTCNISVSSGLLPVHFCNGYPYLVHDATPTNWLHK